MILAAVLLFFLFAGFVSLLVSSVETSKRPDVSGQSVLHIRLELPVTERSSKNPFEHLDLATLKTRSQPGLFEIVQSIDHAAGDDRIEGIYLNTGDIQAGLAAVEEIRQALLRFRESEKFIVAYAPSYSQASYYLASAADRIFLHPEGLVEFKGYVAELIFLKGLFEKLDIEPQVVRHGKYKSALESLVNDRMSDENREQIAALVDGFWQHTIDGIAAARGHDAGELNALADSLAVQMAGDAVRSRLVDSLLYEDEVLLDLALRCGRDSSAGPRLVPIDRYSRLPMTSGDAYAKDRIAVVFGSGEIAGGEGDDENIGSRTLVKALRGAREDDRVKAIVLRVNSVGGQALASDEIWREVSLAREAKPVVASFGDVAASGGYYISCAATRIVAQPNTVTGSIGVIGVLFNLSDFLRNKLGITTDQYKSSRFADLGLPTHALTEGEKEIIRNIIDDIYKDFTGKVSDGRRLPPAFVDSIGQGRVWSGADARRLGLVDTLGSLSDAIALAAELAGIESYRVRPLPEQKEPLQQLLEDFGTRLQRRLTAYQLGEAAAYYPSLKELAGMHPIQARAPFQFRIR
jgi:protease-4